MEEDVVTSLTIEDLVQRINEMCSFFSSTIKYVDRDKDWVDLRHEDISQTWFKCGSRSTQRKSLLSNVKSAEQFLFTPTVFKLLKSRVGGLQLLVIRQEEILRCGGICEQLKK